MIKGSIQEDFTLINIYAPNVEALKHIKKIFLTDIKGEVDGNTVMVEILTRCSHQWTDLLDSKSVRQ